MKVLALNGSPRMKASSTYHMLQPILEGMEKAGAEIEIIHIRKLDLEACIGCYSCWVKTPGECIHKDKDSMAAALESYRAADLIIYGTPLYHFNMSGIMKTFIDRTLPLIEPWLIPHPEIPDTTFHPERFHKSRKMLLVSPCGFPEFWHFDSLVSIFKHMARMERFEYIGEILRPGAEPLSRRTLQGLFTGYYDTLRQAGEQIIRDGGINAETQAELQKDLFPGGKQAFYGMSSAYWEEQMDRFKVPEELRHTVLIQTDDMEKMTASHAEAVMNADVPSVDGRYLVPNEYMLNSMVSMFNPRAMPNLRATVQFTIAPVKNVTFDFGSANWYMNINDGGCSLHEGRTTLPTLTITTPYEVWYDIGMGTLNAEAAFDDGKYEANGSITLLEQFPQIFEYPQPDESGKVNPELDMIMMGMPMAFNPKAAGNMDVTIQFVLGGAGGGMYYQRIQNGKCVAHRGPALNPDMTIHTPANIWLAISKGELDGQQAFMEAKYRASGDMTILLKMSELFKSAKLPTAPNSQIEAKEEEKKEAIVDMSQLNCHDTIAGMPNVFNAKAAGNLIADIQFVVSGEEPGVYHLHIEAGGCSFHEGESTSPSLTIKTPSEVWLAVSRGQLDGQTAFMQQKYTVEGNFSLLMKFNELFKS